MSFLSQVPQGFFATNGLINALPAAVTYQITYDALDALFDRASIPSGDAYVTLLGDGSTVTTAQLQSAINALTHIFRAAQFVKVCTSDYVLRSIVNCFSHRTCWLRLRHPQ